MIQAILCLMLFPGIPIVQNLMIIQRVGPVVVLLQVIRVFISDKIPVPIIQLTPLIVGFIASLIVQHQTMLIVDRTHIN